MGLPPKIWERIRSGQFPDTDAGIVEALCSIGRQLAYRLEKLIDVLERGPEEPDLPLSGPSSAVSIARLVELMRLDLASYPIDHTTIAVTSSGVLLATNALPHSIPLMITNLSNADILYYGDSRATIANAPIIDPETSKKILLSPNSDLFGIVSGASISVAVSQLDRPTV